MKPGALPRIPEAMDSALGLSYISGHPSEESAKPMRPEDKARILDELESRILAESVLKTEAGGLKLSELLEDSAYFEKKRMKEDRGSPTRDQDGAFWDGVQKDLRRTAEPEHKTLLKKVVRHYAEEISGNFDPRVYSAVTKVLPPALSLLLNAVSPLKLVKRGFSELPSLDNTVVIQGQVDRLHKLHDLGTVILVPTHVSNLDSIIIGYALYRMGLPPFIYGAGLNLFSNPLLGYFMHNLGAYTVDRKKSDPLYKDVLKEYATLTLELGYDNLFFPGGTRSRSGAVERRLKLGLLGTGATAYVHNLKKKVPQPKIFIVPCTLSYQLVLEAETLIDDFLKDVGKSRYIIEDDESSRPRRVFEFMSKLVSLDCKIHVTVSGGLDPFGNPVDEDGNSRDPCDRLIDIERYTWKARQPEVDNARDTEFTREVGERITAAFFADNVVECTHVVASAIFGAMRTRNPRLDVLRLLRTGGSDDDIELTQLHREVERLMAEIQALSGKNKIRLGPSLSGRADDIVSDAIARFATYHDKPAAVRKGDRIVPSDRNLLLYYQNRLEGYGLQPRPALAKDHRALAKG